MKAKEMAEILKAAKTDEEIFKAVEKVFLQCNSDMLDLIKTRNAVSDAARTSIIKEVDQKWQAMCKLAPGICDPMGFRKLFEDKVPGFTKHVWGE